MSRVLTFSTKFPAHHPRKGEPTFFVDKIWEAIKPSVEVMAEYYSKMNGVHYIHDPKGKGTYPPTPFEPKGHTIRAGNRWKVGEKFSPRVWSGKPYASKQITFAPDIEVKKVWDIEILFNTNQIHIGIPNGEQQWILLSAGDVAKNDGLEVRDFYNWFDTKKNRKQKVLKCQIICWNENINY